ncbi:hypothetical protein NIES4071_44010 [Calothrix sp. NIES-4071]|nr:hypothetical protein NIES4071_44010 [Calothrix sp. NIES-4071]BAZ58715.1 hypothetical protein NIES4105_43940 [Calothrix sp. NIES-4105]
MKRICTKLYQNLLLVTISLLLASCGRNIPSLQGVSDTVDKLDSKGRDISKDMYRSCIRATQFFGTPGSPTVFTERQPEEKFCDDNYKRVSSVMDNANGVLINYMKALVQVANGEREKGKKITFDASFQTLETSLTNLKYSPSPSSEAQTVFKEAEVKAGVAIAKFLTNLFTKELRRSKLKQAILCTDSSIQTYIKGEGAVEGQPEPGGLVAIAKKVYVDGLLVEEETSIRTYYSEYIALLGDDLRKNPLEFMSVEDKYNTAMDVVRTRKDEAEAYTKILRELSSLHASLKTEFVKDGDIPLTGAKFDKYCQDLFKSSNTKTAEKEQTQEIKPETMRRVQAIIDKHVKVIEPLLQKLNKQR